MPFVEPKDQAQYRGHRFNAAKYSDKDKAELCRRASIDPNSVNSEDKAYITAVLAADRIDIQYGLPDEQRHDAMLAWIELHNGQR